MYTGKSDYRDHTKEMLNCDRCRLTHHRKSVVIYRGNPRSDIMIIGEAPGREEDLEGKPMVGRTGGWLIQLLKNRNLNITDYFVTNLVYCRPPENRDPSSDEIEICTRWLFEHLDLIKPKIIITVGRLSTGFLIPEHIKKSNITTIEGRIYDIDRLNAKVIPIRHPSAITRNKSLEPNYKIMLTELVENVRNILSGAADGI